VRARYFGDFLIERGLVSRERVMAAARRMRQANRTLSSLAQERGWITKAQAEQIHAEQLRRGCIWGEEAISLGLLDQDQVLRLLADQRARQIRLGEALLEAGSLSREALERALVEFADERVLAGSMRRRLPAQLESSSGARFVIEHLSELILRIARLQTRLGDAWEWKGECEHEFRAAAVLSGAEPLELGVAIDRGFGAMLAEGWHEIAESELDDEQITAMVAELLRLVSERARANAAGRGVELRLDSLEPDALPVSGSALELATPYGRGLLVIGVG
jgi:hypothetical protein